MNNKRRKVLEQVSSVLTNMPSQISTLLVMLTAAEEKASLVLDEEQDALDNIPENLQESDICERIEEAVDNIESAMEQIEGARDSAEELLAYLIEADKLIKEASM